MSVGLRIDRRGGLAGFVECVDCLFLRCLSMCPLAVETVVGVHFYSLAAVKLWTKPFSSAAMSVEGDGELIVSWAKVTSSAGVAEAVVLLQA